MLQECTAWASRDTMVGEPSSRRSSAPGAEANHISFRLDGAEKITLKDGNLSIHHSFGEILQSKPLAWEIDENGRKKKVNIAFQLEQDIVSFVFRHCSIIRSNSFCSYSYT